MLTNAVAYQTSEWPRCLFKSEQAFKHCVHSVVIDDSVDDVAAANHVRRLTAAAIAAEAAHSPNADVLKRVLTRLLNVVPSSDVWDLIDATVASHVKTQLPSSSSNSTSQAASILFRKRRRCAQIQNASPEPPEPQSQPREPDDLATLQRENAGLKKQVEKAKALNRKLQKTVKCRSRRIRNLENRLKHKTLMCEAAQSKLTAASYFKQPKRRRPTSTSHHVSVLGGYRMAMKRNQGHASAVALTLHIEPPITRSPAYRWERLLAANILEQSRSFYGHNYGYLDAVRKATDEGKAIFRPTSKLSCEISSIRGDATNCTAIDHHKSSCLGDNHSFQTHSSRMA